MSQDMINLLLIAAAVAIACALLSKRPKGSRCGGDLLAEVNAWRRRGAVCAGVTYPPVPPVATHPTLQHVAQLFADDLARHQIRAGHIGSDGSTFGERLTRAGFRWTWAGENTAYNTNSAAATVAAFAASPDHCPNLMSPQATHCGLACASDGQRAYWVQLMGRPA
jgi:uncharacterized protein YkwD